MDYQNDQNPKGVNFLLEKLGDSAPEYVREKSAGQDDKPTKFALPNREEYPRSNPREVWLSYAYLKTANVGYSEGTKDFIENQLRQSAAIFETEFDLDQIDETLAEERKKQASSEPMQKYALNIERNGESFNFYPMNTVQQIRNSMHQIKNACDLPIEWKKKACTALVDAAEESGIRRSEIPSDVLEMGIRREPDFEKAAQVARYRSTFVKDREGSDLYSEIVKSAAADDESQIDHYIELMIDLDRAEGIANYGKGVVDPYSAFYSGPETAFVEKVANENAFVMDTLIPTEAFRNTRDYVNTVFSKKASKAIVDIIDEHGKDGVELSRQISKLPLETQRELTKLAVVKG